jgi:serine/threonine-protein kinase
MKEDRLSMMFVADVEAPAPEAVSNGFKKYAHFRELNSGGKAMLTLCRDTNLGRDVVLKRLRPEFRDDKIELARLLREAKITSQLQHPATVPVYELGKDDQGDFYFAMKNIVGHTLFEIICALARREKEAESHFTLNRLLTIFTQVGEAIHYAHVRGIIHRDVKPENVIVGMFGEVNLIDWGTAKVWGMPYEGDGEGRAKLQGGTPLYMSPEQVLASHSVDERSDIFSMGVVLYEMLAQREPFRGRQRQETFDNIVNASPMPPSEAAPHRSIPEAIERICLKAMQKSPSNRYQSMQTMLDDIAEFLNTAVQRGVG